MSRWSKHPPGSCRVRRLGLAAGLAAGASLALAGVAAGHAVVVRTEPADGAIVAEPPREVVLVFSERVSVDLSEVSIVDSHGRAVAPTAVGHGSEGPETLVVSLPPLPDDVYRISWTTVSDDDLHATRGALVIAVGAADGALQSIAAAGTDSAADGSGPGLAGLGSLARSAQLLGLALLLGGLVLGLLSAGVDPELGPTLRRRLLRLATIGAVGAALTGLGRLAVAAADGRTGLDALVVGSAFGGRSIAEIGALVAVALLVGSGGDRPLGRRPTVARGRAVAVAGLLGLVALLDGANGHLAARDGLAGLGLATVHLCAAGLWVGGLLGLALVVPGRRSPSAGGRDAAAARLLLRRFSPLAALAVGLLAVSGALAGGELVATPDALLTSDYGRVLLAKTTLVGLVAFLGLRNAATVQPLLRAVMGAVRRSARATFGPVSARLGRVGGGRLGRVGGGRLTSQIRLEAAAAALVVAAAGGLAETAPARGPAYDPLPAAAVHPSASGRAADLVVTLTVRPNRPGRNIAAIGVFDTRRPAPAPIVGVTLVRSDPTGATRVGLPARPVGEGRYEVGGELFESPGQWLVGIVVERAGLAPASFVADWDVPPATTPAERPTLVAQVPLGDLTRPAAIVIALGFGGSLGTLALVGRRRRARHHRPFDPKIARPMPGEGPGRQPLPELG